ncbi:MAG: LytTR family transcriptional regulator, partial [Methylocystis sp.]
EISRLGLEALTQALNARTSFAPGDPVGVDPAKDELAFYPLLYWPIVASAPQPPAKTVAKVTAYMKQGGTIIFDTRDALSQRVGGAPSPEAQWLRDLTKGLDIPPLEVTPRDHVITKTFYLLDGFVGRYANGETWVEALPPEPKDQAARPVRATDSVSAIVITSNDLASAWAHDKRGQPLFPLTPGGARQREFALRGGINLVMYTLTGNYKSDQVHVRDLLERLGQ